MFPSSVAAEPSQWVSDAFGLFDHHTQPERLNWAGVQHSGPEKRMQRPLAPTDLQILMFEKSMVAGRGQAMAVALGTDIFGNLMGDGLETAFTLTSQSHMESAYSHQGLSYVIISANRAAGLYSASAHIPAQPQHSVSLQSERQIYRITADLAGIDLALNNPKLGHIQTILQSTPLKDPYGNQAANGLGLAFGLHNQQSGAYSLIPAVSVNGVGTVRLPRTLLANQQTVQLLTGLKQTGGLDLTSPLPALHPSIPLATEYDADLGLLHLVWGPIQTDQNHLAPDGLAVEIELATDLFDPSIYQAWVETGYVHASLFLWEEDFPARVTLDSPFGHQIHEVQRWPKK